ncbi:MAG: cyclic nucleotide-binding domain-containing protein [Ignavibacteria bacterium]|nr:cyclic nucleotide-binding domain-containing protein [Ignavibacteria bacterium]
MLRNKNNTDSITKAVRNCNLFSDFSDREIKKLISISHIRDYSEGEKIFSEGSLGICFYLIVKGSVSVVTEKDGELKEVREFGEGACFSEVHIFTETYHSVSCISKDVTRLLVLSRPDIEDLMKIDLRFTVRVMSKFLNFFGTKLQELYEENRKLKLSSF